MKKAKAIANLKGLKPSELKIKGQVVKDGITGNTALPHCVPYATELQTKVGTLDTAITAGGTTPSELQKVAIIAAEDAIKLFLNFICAGVNVDGNGDETILLSSGFELKTYSPASPKSFIAKLGKLSGEIFLEINSYGAAAYYWEMTTDPIGATAWVKADLTTTSKTIIKGLTPGTKLWFRVSITKSNKVVVVSDPYTIMVV